MIRINLNGEKKGTPVKAKRKKREQVSELEQNLVLLICILVGIGVFFFIGWKIKSAFEEQRRIRDAKKAEYKTLEKWTQKKLEYDIQKELLTEKINKISQLKERREGPVKLLEDVFNNLPKSIWIDSIIQGYDRRLTNVIERGMDVLKPGQNIGKPNRVRLIGQSRTQDAAGTFANRIQGLDTRYKNVTLNTIIEKEGNAVPVYQFKLFLEMVPGYEKVLKAEQSAADEGGQK